MKTNNPLYKQKYNNRVLNALQKKKIERNPLQISPLCTVVKTLPSKHERGIANFGQHVHIRGRFTAYKEDNIKYGKQSKLVLEITKNDRVALIEFLFLVHKLMKLRWHQKIIDPVLGFKKLILPIHTSSHLLDIVRPHLENEKSNDIVDCDIVVSRLWFKDENDVLLCMKMYDLVIPTDSNIVDMDKNITESLSVSNEVNCKLCLSDLKNDRSQFVAFEKPIMVSGTFSIAEIQDFENSKYTKFFSLLGASDGHLFLYFCFSPS